MRVSAQLTADHGGQAWFMIACGTTISEDMNWTILERSVNERDYAALPSNPAIYAWAPQSLKNKGDSTDGFATTFYHVPSSFSCPGGVGVGRWLWKTGNTCNDVNNVGRSTESFSASEARAVGLDRSVCNSPPETFISCFDFKLSGNSQPSPGPAPTPPAPTPPSPAPTQAPPSPPPAGPGLCCYGGCGGGNCQGGWCGESQGN